MKSYFQLYKRAGELLQKEAVALTQCKTEPEKDTYYFTVETHETKLVISREGTKDQWVRDWSCDCRTYALWQDKYQCKHIVACEGYLINGGYVWMRITA